MFNAIVYTVLVISLISNVYLFMLANKHWHSIRRVAGRYASDLSKSQARVIELKRQLASTNDVCAKALELNREQYLKIQELKNRISF